MVPIDLYIYYWFDLVKQKNHKKLYDDESMYLY